MATAKEPRTPSVRSGAIGTSPVKEPVKLIDHDVAGTNPNNEQWAPTDSQAMRQHHRMAGTGK